MSQQTLFAPPAERAPLTPARTRRRDPITSSAAADDVNRSGAAARHEERILEVLRRSSVSLTACEIGSITRLTNVQICRRMGSAHGPDGEPPAGAPSLEGRGLVRRAEVRQCRCSEHRGRGRAMQTWRSA